MRTLTIRSRKTREVIDITGEVGSALRESGVPEGECHLFATHTTAALTLMDLDPGTDLDLLDTLDAMMPRLRFRHAHNPAHTPAHLWSAIIGPALWVPVRKGVPQLGTWQRIVLLEFDGPRAREIRVSVIPTRQD